MFDVIGLALVVGAIVIVAGLVLYTAREAWQSGYDEGWAEAHRHYNVVPLDIRPVDDRPATRGDDTRYPYRGEVD